MKKIFYSVVISFSLLNPFTSTSLAYDLSPEAFESFRAILKKTVKKATSASPLPEKKLSGDELSIGYSMDEHGSVKLDDIIVVYWPPLAGDKISGECITKFSPNMSKSLGCGKETVGAGVQLFDPGCTGRWKSIYIYCPLDESYGAVLDMDQARKAKFAPLEVLYQQLVVAWDPIGTFSRISKPKRDLTDKDFHLMTTILDKAVKTIGTNPRFRVHGMGLDLVGDIGRKIRRDQRIQEFQTISPTTRWEDLPENVQSVLFKIVNDNISEEKLNSWYRGWDRPETISEILKEAESNPNISVMCCGHTCMYSIIIETEKNKRWSVELDYYDQLEGRNDYPVCHLRWSFPPSIGDVLSGTDRSQITHIYGLKDKGCMGSFTSIKINDIPTISLETNKAKDYVPIEDLYRKFLRFLDPIGTYERSPKEECDI